MLSAVAPEIMELVKDVSQANNPAPMPGNIEDILQGGQPGAAPGAPVAPPVPLAEPTPAAPAAPPVPLAEPEV
jgi:hypothetical protein